MVLNMTFSRPLKGSCLIDVLERSMKQMKGWCVNVTDKVHHTVGYACVKQADFFPNRIMHFVSLVEDGPSFSPSAYFDLYQKNIVAKYCVVCMTRSASLSDKQALRARNMDIFGACILAPFSLGVSLITIVGDMKRYEPQPDVFSAKDSIFALVEPDESYLNLEFYANIGIDLNNPRDTGRVESDVSTQFKKLEPAFNELEEYVYQKINLPYR